MVLSWLVLFASYLKSLPMQRSHRLSSPMFSSRSFTAFGLTLGSVIHFKLISDYGEVMIKVQFFAFEYPVVLITFVEKIILSL